MYYVQEADKLGKFMRKFNIIKQKQENIFLPIQEEEKEKRLEKLGIKTKKIIDRTNSRKVIVSKIIKKQEKYLNYLHSNGIEIVDGRWLFEMLSLKILEYIIDLRDMKKEETQISVLTNYIQDRGIETIKRLSKEYKRVNIVTNHIERFKKIEEQIYDEFGIMITVVNNKKRSLLKSHLILNLDFPEELLNTYNIYENAIIINIHGNVKVHKKRFNGIVINDYEILVLKDKDIDYEKIGKFYTKDLYEAKLYKKQRYQSIIEQIDKDEVSIKNLFTNYGALEKI